MRSNGPLTPSTFGTWACHSKSSTSLTVKMRVCPFARRLWFRTCHYFRHTVVRTALVDPGWPIWVSLFAIGHSWYYELKFFFQAIFYHTRGLTSLQGLGYIKQCLQAWWRRHSRRSNLLWIISSCHSGKSGRLSCAMRLGQDCAYYPYFILFAILTFRQLWQWSSQLLWNYHSINLLHSISTYPRRFQHPSKSKKRCGSRMSKSIRHLSFLSHILIFLPDSLDKSVQIKGLMVEALYFHAKYSHSHLTQNAPAITASY